MNAIKAMQKKLRRQKKHRIQNALKRATKGQGYLGTARAARVLIDRKCIRIDEGGAA